MLAADYVATEEGTGIVHIAPGFGEDDQVVANAAGIPTIVPMDEHGRYTADVPTWAGVQVFDANPLVIRHLKEHSFVLRHETYNHSYPHCWRCSKPLVYRAISSWFVAVTKFRDRMVELNEEINWVPATSSTAASASGWRTPATGRSAATASGARRSRCGAATIRATRGPTCTARSPTSRPTSG